MDAAFESVSRDYLRELLRLLGVGTKFIKMLNCLWEGMSGHVSYGGVEQEAIPMGGGLTQGAPESALLFNLVFIPLNTVLGNLMTRAYCVGNNLKSVARYTDEMQRRRLISYSDDTNYICKLNEEEISMFLEIMGEFCKISQRNI